VLPPMTTESAPAPGFWASVRESLRGSHHDYTTGPLGRAILLLAVPMVLEMVMESVFAVVDIFFVGKIGPAAIATVGLTETLITVVYTVAFGVSIGVAATVARRIGEKDPDAAAHTAMQGIWLGLAISIPMAIIGVFAAPSLLALMGAGPDVLAIGSGYARILLGGNVVILLIFIINAAFRGAGDPAVAMRVLWVGNGINIVLNPCLILGLGPFHRFGVTGSAIATMIGRGTGVLYQLWILKRGSSRLVVRRAHIALDVPLMGRLLKLSGAATLQNFIGSASWIGLMRVVAPFGSTVVAGYTIAIRVIIFVLLPSWGLSNAGATLVGQSLGAKNPERAAEASWRAAFYNFVFLGVFGIGFVAASPWIVGLFTHDAEAVLVGARALLIIGVGLPVFAYAMVLSNAFNGAGDTWTPTWMNFACFWVFEVPLAWWLAMRAGWGPDGVFTAITVAFTVYAIVAVVLFRREKWMKVAV
ncbi:MAG: MATE family efflux transporter, partial [Gemmatimonadales bacterium]